MSRIEGAASCTSTFDNVIFVSYKMYLKPVIVILSCICWSRMEFKWFFLYKKI